MSFKYKILSIDGGGIRGIIPAVILAEIENITEKPIAESFDLIAGTSTGGLIALALTTKSEEDENKPKYTAQKLADIYSGEQGKAIFTLRSDGTFPDLPHWLKPLEPLFPRFLSWLNDYLKLGLSNPNELFNSKFTSRERDRVFREILGDNTMLEESLAEVLVISYDTALRLPVFFDFTKH